MQNHRHGNLSAGIKWSLKLINANTGLVQDRKRKEKWHLVIIFMNNLTIGLLET